MTSHTELATRSGIVLDVRPATPADAEALRTLFRNMNEEDRRFRFFTAGEHLSQEQLQPLLEVDRLTSESFLAFDKASGALVASALLASDRELDTGEVAVAIRNDYRNKGVGWALLDFLAQEAQRRGVRRVIAIESRNNHAAIELEREKGFTPEDFDGDPTLVILSRTFG